MGKAKGGAAKKTTNQIMLPVVVFDGECKTNMGNIKIHHDLVFNEFQTMVTELIGIHYDHVTTYLVDGRKSKASTEPWKIPITDKTNFALMIRLKNCYFFVVLKPPRTECKMIPGNQSDLLRMHWNLLDANKKNAQMSAYSPCYYDYSNDDRFPELNMQSEKYLSLISNSSYGLVSSFNVNIPKIEMGESSSNRVLCEDCTAEQEQGKTAEFHLCVYDEVIEGFFRSLAGPISRRR